MPTPTDVRRFQRFQEIGCIACRKRGHFGTPEVHHVLNAGRRVSHQHTIPLCPWHHRGVQLQGISERALTSALGPSLALAPRGFRAEFGEQLSLLAEVNALL